MTHREVFRRINEFQPTDWVPDYELGAWGHTFERWHNEGLPSAPDIDCNWFDGAAGLGLAGRSFAPVNLGMMPGFEYELIEETDRYLIARHGNGVVTKALKEGTVRGTRLCMDEYIGFPVTDRASFQGLKHRYDPTAPERYPQNWNELKLKWQATDQPLCLLTNGSFGLYSGLRSWVGTLPLSYMLYDDQPLIEEMVEFMTDFMIATVDRALQEVQFDYFNFFEDLAGKGGPLISPQLFRKFLLPAYKRIIDHMRGAGVKYFWVDSDGDPLVLLPLWLEAGITGFWPLEQASGMDPRRLRREFGSDLLLAGGLDNIEVAKGRAAIDQELGSKIPPLLETGGYIPHLDHTFSPEISYDDFQYYLEVKRKLIGL